MSRSVILYVITTSDLGGAEAMLETLINRLNSRRFIPVLCTLCHQGKIAQKIAAQGVATVNLGMSPKPRLQEMFTGVRQLGRVIDEHEVHLVQSQLYRANVLVAIASRIARRRPRVVAVQHSLKHYKKSIIAAMTAFLTRPLCHRLVAVSEAVKQKLVRLEGLSPRSITVIDNGIDTEKYKPSQREEACLALNLNPEAVIVGTVGRITRVKGLRYLIKALGRAREHTVLLELVVVGDGPERPALENLSRELGLGDQVSFLGVRREVEKIYPAFDIFALPSIREASPMALLEAMACGVSVVASRVGGIPFIVDDNHSGVLVEPRDTTALADALFKLASRPNFRQKIALEARKRVENKFTVREMVHKYEDLYHSLLSDPS